MDPTLLIQGAGLLAVVFAMAVETQLTDRRGRTRHASAQPASPPQRCPFCHNDFEPEEETARCRSCGTTHHSECWDEHGECTVMGCPSVERCGELPARAAVTEPLPRG